MGFEFFSFFVAGFILLGAVPVFGILSALSQQQKPLVRHDSSAGVGMFVRLSFVFCTNGDIAMTAANTTYDVM